jgi:hypothetical protein
MEKPARNKHSSLLRIFFTYNAKSIKTLGTGVKKKKKIFVTDDAAVKS